MDPTHSALDVDGQTIRTGVSLFDTRTGEILWYLDVRNGTVRLETVDGRTEMPEDEFREDVKADEICVETH